MRSLTDLQRVPLLLFHGALGGPDDWRGLDWPDPVEAQALNLSQPPSSIPKSAVLLGYSLGARAAVDTARKTIADKDAGESSIRALILESYHPGCADKADLKLRTAFDETVIKAVENNRAELLETWYEQDVFKSLDEEVIANLRKQKTKRDAGYMVRVLESWALSRCPLAGATPMPAVPILLIAGEQDPKYVELAKQTAAREENVTLAIIPGVGHIPHIEKPPLFIEAVAAFLQSLPTLPDPGL